MPTAVLTELRKPQEEVDVILDGYRKRHLGELQAMAAEAGTSIGYTGHAAANEDSHAPAAALTPAAAH